MLSDTQTNIHLRNVRGATVTGNTMWRSGEWSLLIEGSRADEPNIKITGGNRIQLKDNLTD